jgi:hypothetical protein
MKKFLVGLVLAFGILLFGATTSFAYEDQIIEIDTGLGLELPSFYEESYLIQESLISELENLLGFEIEHFYYIIYIDGVKFVAIDPPVPLFKLGG